MNIKLYYYNEAVGSRSVNEKVIIIIIIIFIELLILVA